MEAFGLTTIQLSVLIATYYADIGWIPEHYNERRGITPEIKKLVNDGMLYITSMVREVSTVKSMSSVFVNFVSSPASVHCAVAITEPGKELVKQINLSRRADACIAEGDIYIIRNFINSLDIKDLPEFLSHSHQQLREEASKQLDYCLESLPAEDLPELLTDSDSVVRDTASGVLAHSIGVEE